MKKISIPKETIEYVVKTFKFKNEASKYLGVDIYVLNRLLKEYNIEFPKNPPSLAAKHTRTFDYIDKTWLIENWVNTSKSMRELAEQEGCNESLIDSRRACYGLSKKFCYPLNRNKLFDITDPHLWYLAGLTATDGYVPAAQDTIEIGLTGDSEKELILDIHNYYECTCPIYQYDERHTVIRITSEGLNAFISEQFNIPQGAKTFSVGVPKSYYNEDCAKAYFRGCLDGDGSIGKDGKGFGILTASYDFIEGVAELLRTYVGPDYHLRVEGSYPQVSAGGSTGKRALDWAYSLKNCFRLKRKYERYLLS